MKKLFFFCLLAVVTACTNPAVDKFIGQWQFYKMVSEKTPENISMNGLICPLKKVEGTYETYSFTFATNIFILKQKDKNTLIGDDDVVILKYDEATHELLCIMNLTGVNNNAIVIEFKKIK